MIYLLSYFAIGGILAAISFVLHGQKDLKDKSRGFQAVSVVVYILIWPIWLLVELWRFLIKL